MNIQTAFTVGTEPSMDCTPTDDDEKKLLDAVKAVFKSNKIKYQNKKIVRAWLSEQEAAEYWYVTDDDSFWAKFWKKVKTTFGGKVKPTKKLKSVLWSPFRGDKLYPFFNDEGKMIAFSREYKRSSWMIRRSPVLWLLRTKWFINGIYLKDMKKELLLLMDSPNYRFSMPTVLNLIAKDKGFSGSVGEIIIQLCRLHRLSFLPFIETYR